MQIILIFSSGYNGEEKDMKSQRRAEENQEARVPQRSFILRKKIYLINPLKIFKTRT